MKKTYNCQFYPQKSHLLEVSFIKIVNAINEYIYPRSMKLFMIHNIIELNTKKQ